MVSPQHTNFSIRSSGLIISSLFPYLAASPDGIITCDCCGVGTLEIKCPFCRRDESPEVAEIRYLSDVTNETRLKENHSYYYQVQAQINICQVEYGDFVIWTPGGIHVERILCDEAFFMDTVDKISSFYIYGVLPDVLGKWYTKQPVFLSNESTSGHITELESATQSSSSLTSDQQEHVDDQQENMHVDTSLWCYCQKPESGDMIGCDYPSCTIGWFHISCLKLKYVPEGKWYCPDCRKKFKGRHPPSS